MGPVKPDVSFGEKVYIPLQSRDQLNNSRESVYSVNLPTAQVRPMKPTKLINIVI